MEESSLSLISNLAVCPEHCYGNQGISVSRSQLGERKPHEAIGQSHAGANVNDE
jgi:hypothetical protein